MSNIVFGDKEIICIRLEDSLAVVLDVDDRILGEMEGCDALSTATSETKRKSVWEYGEVGVASLVADLGHAKIENLWASFVLLIFCKIWLVG